MLLNLLDEQFNELDIIQFPFGTLSMPPLKLLTARKYTNLIQQLNPKNKKVSKTDIKIVEKLLDCLVEWLNTNVEEIKVTTTLLEDTLSQKQLNALVKSFGETIVNIEKK